MALPLQVIVAFGTRERFDALVTLLSLVAELAALEALVHSHPIGPLVLSALAVSRALRVTRLLTITHYFDELWSIVSMSAHVSRCV